MKVISGTARGKNLETLDGLATRPTIARVKEGIFSSVQFLIPGAAVLDLFAGSGQMGIECLSRGAKSCVFVDQSKEAIGVVTRNVKNCSLSQNAKIVNSRSRYHFGIPLCGTISRDYRSVCPSRLNLG